MTSVSLLFRILGLPLSRPCTYTRRHYASDLFCQSIAPAGEHWDHSRTDSPSAAGFSLADAVEVHQTFRAIHPTHANHSFGRRYQPANRTQDPLQLATKCPSLNLTLPPLESDRMPSPYNPQKIVISWWFVKCLDCWSSSGFMTP